MLRMLLIFLFIVIISFVFLFKAKQRFRSTYAADVNRNFSEQNRGPGSILTEEDCADLPPVIQKYLRFTNVIGKPKVTSFLVKMEGGLRADERSSWMPFKSEQYNFIADPARLFFLDAKMKGLPVAGYHQYVGGKAKMDIRLLSLFSVQYLEGNLMDIAETVTFFNDMCIMAPATLIDKRISWTEEDSNKVKATFNNGNIKISAWLYFDNDGRLINFESDDRYNASEKRVMKWLTPVTGYRSANSGNIPVTAEAVYREKTGDFVYGKFRVTEIVINPVK